MTVRVLSIEPRVNTSGSRFAATYDVWAEVDAQAYTFEACVELVTIGDRTVQCANLCDSQSRELFRWHQSIPVGISKLIFAAYNNEPVVLPVYIDEPRPVAQPAS